MRVRTWFPVCVALCLVPRVEAAVGFQSVVISADTPEPLRLSLWYPSDAEPAEHRIGLFMQRVAPGAAPAGQQLPLILISHGTGGSRESHLGTALALAEAGFVVAAVEHPGDSYRDQSRAADIEQRPLALTRVIVHMLDSWQHRAVIDAERIGAFGFSAGGFTVLALAGGQPDLSRLGPHCEANPRFFDCGIARGRLQQTAPALAAAASTAAPRPAPAHALKAIVVAAPALGFTMAGGLDAVRIPVQLWRADEDEVLPAPHYADAVRVALPTPPEFHAVPGARHFDFLTPCSEELRRIAPPICRSADGFDRGAFQQTFDARVVEFFQRELAAPQP
jgi:predicted dienelactone hydrolase